MATLSLLLTLLISGPVRAQTGPPLLPPPPGMDVPPPGGHPGGIDHMGAPGGEPITTRLAVSSLTGTEDLTLRAFARWGDQDLQTELTDDGSTPGDLPQDGIWVGVWTGPPVAAIDVRLVLERTAQPPMDVYQGLERISGPEDRLSWSLDLGSSTATTPKATRISAPYIARRLEEVDATSRVASYGWLLVLGVWVAWLGERRLSRARRSQRAESQRAELSP